MSRILLFAGNGLDIHLGLGTSYPDFYAWLIRKHPDFAWLDAIESEPQGWSDLELALGIYSRELNHTGEYLRQKREVENYLSEFLQEQSGQFCPDSQQMELYRKILRNDLLVFWKALPPDEADFIKERIENSDPITYTFLSFNYTDCLDALIAGWDDRSLPLSHREKACTDHVAGVYHLHGRLGQPLVLGLDNASQLADQSLLEKGRPELIKKDILEQHQHQFVYGPVEDLLAETFLCLLYGVSLGATDAIWWKMLALWLERDASRRLLIYIYRSAEQDADEQNEFFERRFGVYASEAGVRWENIRDQVLFVDADRFFCFSFLSSPSF